MKSERLLALLMFLQARGRATERELAQHLEVSQRTIHRDLEALSMARVPVIALRGAQGGWELDKGWRAQVPGLNDDELYALMLAQPRAVGDPRLVAAAESALTKLVAALPDPMRQQARTIHERLYVDSSGWWEDGEDVSWLPLLQEAVAKEHQISFDYVRADGSSGERIADPLGLVVKGTAWYLVGRTAAGMRSFRLSRMENLKVLSHHFRRPRRFLLSEFWKRSVEELEGKRRGYQVRMMVTTRAAQRLRAWCAVRPASQDHMPRLQQGWEEVEVEFDHPGQARFVVMGLGSNVLVREPEELKLQVEEEIDRMSRRSSQPESFSRS